MPVDKNLEPEEVRQNNDTVFIVYRTAYYDDNRKEFIIEAVYRDLEDAEEYAEDNFMKDEFGTIQERIIK